MIGWDWCLNWRYPDCSLVAPWLFRSTHVPPWNWCTVRFATGFFFTVCTYVHFSPSDVRTYNVNHVESFDSSTASKDVIGSRIMFISNDAIHWIYSREKAYRRYFLYISLKPPRNIRLTFVWATNERSTKNKKQDDDGCFHIIHICDVDDGGRRRRCEWIHNNSNT